MKQRAREERLQREEEARAAAQKRARLVRIATGGAVSLAIVAGVAFLVVGIGSGGGGNDGFPIGPSYAKAFAIDEGSESELAKVARKAKCTENNDTNEGETHQAEDFSYSANPPTSGNHDASPAEDAAYAPGDEPPTERLIHSLEHGRVVFQWRDGQLTQAQLGSLKRLFDDNSYHLLLARNSTDMPAAVAATAWQRSLTCSEVNDDTFTALRLFQLSYSDQGPEQVP